MSIHGRLARTDRIRQRAHTIWEAEGRPEGRDRDHWYRATREVEEEERLPAPEDLNPGSPEGIPKGVIVPPRHRN